MKLLLDTNAIIPAEPVSPENIESQSPVVAVLLRLIAEGEHQHFIHPVSIDELEGDQTPSRREARRILVTKYPPLPAPPDTIHESILDKLSDLQQNKHEQADCLLLTCLVVDAVDYLVTEDRGIHRKARQLDIAERVLSISEAVAALRGLLEKIPSPPPAVERVLCHEISDSDHIFNRLRLDYQGFDNWLKKCKREHRPAWIIKEHGGSYAGICIMKKEAVSEYGLKCPSLKICTFKVSDQHRGRRYGELLLKAVFNYISSNGIRSTYLTVFDRHSELVRLLEAFGFLQIAVNPNGESVMAKQFQCTGREIEALSCLDAHIRYGPPFIKLSGNKVFIVPIKPQWHALLFPELTEQTSLFAGAYPFGNSIMKAYLCNSNIRRISPGDILLFYQSNTAKSVSPLGVVEKSLVSAEGSEIQRFVGKRTVFSSSDISAMCRGGKQTLAILFRQDRNLVPPFTLETLKQAGLLNGPPMSIVEVKESGISWLSVKIPQQP
ncbi:GNAT family N-acetyltransferase [Synechococcus sp. Lug-A]|uniref:GNAT family N-acetyltransferase n=1 Tax=Synechococcus sp. Lug-A TaxID=2823740 RepID=UPI0020CE8ABD|nr:GNAT family N-acetyltransferase [Synechococcus sp. Lug-A]MCP9847708.1 GNAT family N-acetyltransferase [Synechococcus sp. Lug-A]